MGYETSQSWVYLVGGVGWREGDENIRERPRRKADPQIRKGMRERGGGWGRDAGPTLENKEEVHKP